jgi:hypothetical protein
VLRDERAGESYGALTMTMEQLSALADCGRWVDQADKLLVNLGFDLIEPDRANGGRTSHLLSALRPLPTLKHFDPEEIAYWATEGGRGRAGKLDRDSRYPIDSTYAWGRITLTDRLGINNQFLSFGGALRAELTSAGVVVVDFSSHAPILRWSGHSQGLDPLTAEVGGFFARMKVPIDFVPGTEALVAAATPNTLYCAFVQYVNARLKRNRTLSEANRSLSDWSSRESLRMESVAADHWKAAQELRRHLGLIEAVARE